MVPTIGGDWVVVQSDDEWHMPGGTIEPGETFDQQIRRELLEEAGAELDSYTVLGVFHCHSSQPAPFRPHLPHPNGDRVIVTGEVRLVGPPTNPVDGEQVTAVEAVQLDEALRRLRDSTWPAQADLYMLSGQL